MLKHLFIITLFVSVRNTNCQRVIDTVCTLEVSEDIGLCRLLSDCPKIQEDIIKNQRLPQTCGFQSTQPIVCCPIDITGERRIPGAISNKRCRQYSSISNNNECGHKIVKRIVGGVKANRHEFPHMVILGFDKSPGVIDWTCAGSLISDQFILTAAHCISTQLGPVKYAKMGATNLNDADRQQFNIIDHIRHPEYSPLSLYNNIGLLKLEQPINISQSLRPACLYTLPELPDEGVVTGWGRTEFVGKASDDLLKVTIPIVDHETCSKIFDVTRKLKQGILKKSQFCAGTKGKDTCQGDSGGPLQVVNSGNDSQCTPVHDIVGLTSFGKGCGFGEGVYTKIKYYLQWIEDIVWPTFSRLSIDD